jgi:hypothetical protein
MSKRDPRRFYVYMWLRSKDSKHGPRLSPYYVGKGAKLRAFDARRRGAKPPKDQSYIVFVQEGLTEQEALALEQYCIALYGRIDNGTGILRNLTNGGEGVSGFKFSEELRQRLSKSHTGHRHSEETRKKMSRSRSGPGNPNYGKKGMVSAFKGRKHTEESKRLMAEANRGKKASEETKRKQKEALVRYVYELTDPSGNRYIVDNLTDFAAERGLARSHLSAIAKGKRKSHKGWTACIIERLR